MADGEHTRAHDAERAAGTCVHHAFLAKSLAKMGADVAVILKCLGDGKVNFATLSLRVRILEMIVYGGVGLALTGVGVGVLAVLLGG